MTQQKEVTREAKPGCQCEQIARNVLRPQLADKEQRHADDAGHDNNQIALSKLFFVNQRLEYQKVNGRRVLQEDRICRRRFFCGQHEKKEQGRI
jgi:hypothetical protein